MSAAHLEHPTISAETAKTLAFLMQCVDCTSPAPKTVRTSQTGPIANLRNYMACCNGCCDGCCNTPALSSNVLLAIDDLQHSLAGTTTPVSVMETFLQLIAEQLSSR